MSALTNEKCTACRRDAPRVTEAEIGELRPQIPDWTLVEREGIQRLERVFRFTNFAEALNFTNRVGALAEKEGHHPAILTEWGRVTVTLWTHKIRGLHRNDFIIAAKLDSPHPQPSTTWPGYSDWQRTFCRIWTASCPANKRDQMLFRQYHRHS